MADTIRPGTPLLPLLGSGSDSSGSLPLEESVGVRGLLDRRGLSFSAAHQTLLARRGPCKTWAREGQTGESCDCRPGDGRVRAGHRGLLDGIHHLKGAGVKQRPCMGPPWKPTSSATGYQLVE